MIVRMKKLTLLCLDVDIDRSLETLRDLGVVHLTHVNKPEAPEIDATRDQLQSAESALRILSLYAPQRKHEEKPESDPALNDPSGTRRVIHRIHDLHERRARVAEELERLQQEISRIEPFGDFKPDVVEQLQARGVFVKLYQAPARNLPEIPDHARLHILHQSATGVYFAVISTEEIDLSLRPIALPSESLDELRKKVSSAREDISAIESQISSLSQEQVRIDGEIERLRHAVKYLEARNGMGSESRIRYLQGFCPVESVYTVSQQAGSQGWALLVEEPDENDAVPTLIRNPAWVRPVESLFRMIKILPGYREIDVSTAFLLFLSLFFAMIVGDAGYGLIFLAITIVARLRMRKAPGEPFALLTIFSVCTIIWGVLSGNYLGLTHIAAPLRDLRMQWLQDNNHVMALCLVLGAVHLSLAHLWNAFRAINSFRCLAQFGWVGITWTMFYAARNLLLNQPFPHWMIPTAIGSLAAILLFMTPINKLKTQWADHAMLPQTIIASFGDVLSYLRLFALGIASVKVAGAFNTMAGTIGFGNVFTSLGSALVLFVGHSLNIALCCLSVLVHGIRLNALEFSLHLGLEWAGFEYAPFSKIQKTNMK